LRGIYLIKSPLTPLFQRGGLNTYIEMVKEMLADVTFATPNKSTKASD
jgi:hypothetical protein